MEPDIIFSRGWNGTSETQGWRFNNNNLGATQSDITRVVRKALKQCSLMSDLAQCNDVVVVKGIHQWADPHCTLRVSDYMFHANTTTGPDFTCTEVTPALPPPNPEGFVEVFWEPGLPPPNPAGFVEL